MSSSDQTPSSPGEIVQRRRKLAGAGDREAEIELFAPDAVVEFPFAPPGVPARFQGHAEIMQMHNKLDKQRGSEMESDPEQARYTVHEATDSETVIGELEAGITIPTTGEKITLRQVHVYRVRDGRIVSVRDYFDAATGALVQQALGSN